MLPELAERLEAGLRAQGQDALAGGVASLRVTRVCPCDVPACASFWTTSLPMKRWLLRGRQIELEDGLPGDVVVDVVRGEIVYVEVLGWDEARRALAPLR